ncbi:hypothetical protein JHL21_00290 [Devosia sp. WQ 349]|uniref:hypothetical protein n=1 Tax=Devosia sp. WQ 349K1 TaxID=2800329 RepID=UPI0019084129|nr:hypothetical protein [Devosia sp. WQ 349K1]MBK1792931.1 hypothetical protein [Devosia sp. WQ 349K1]
MLEWLLTYVIIGLEQVPAIVQVIFWGTGSVLAILTYRRARKTLLQPAKTEVFKLQVQKLQHLLDFLSWNGQVEAWEKSGLEESFAINAHDLIDRYADSKGLKREGGTPRIKPHSSLVSVGSLDDNFALIEPGEREFSRLAGTPKAIDWSDYTPWALHMGPTLHATFEQIRRFRADPVIPTFVANALEQIESDLHSAMVAFGPTMKSCAALMAKHYLETDDVKLASWSWLPNQHPAEAKYDFYEKIVELRLEIRSYLKSDQMFDL